MGSKENSHLTLISILYVLGICHLGLFLYDFFPVNTRHSKRVIQPPKDLNNISLNAEENYQPEVNRVIFVVIDALRNDFVNEIDMPYVYSEMHKETGCYLRTKAESPTVTMPRLKAMTTGSVPQFIDLILNFASTEISEDSWLHRAQHAGKKIVFYGDNTWLKLFPKMFIRSEGTTSFYVTDYTEVDNNVTRHLDNELIHKKDWDILILHYLGLDHIGHVYGSFNPLIKNKLLEMDRIIKRIHDSILKQDNKTIIVICGDHGMRDVGGHGGSSDAETLVPLIFLGKHCTARRYPVMQTDIAPTLSALMGLTLPGDSVGRILSELTTYSTLRRLYLLHYNAIHLIENHYERYIDQFKHIFDEHVDYILQRKLSSQNIIDDYENKIFEISSNLIRSSTEQHISFLYLSFSSLTIILLAQFNISTKNVSVTFGVTLLLLFFRNSQIVIVYCMCLLIIFIYSSLKLFRVMIKHLVMPSRMLTFLLAGTCIRTIALASSSFIEEEQQIWYYLWGSVVIFGAYEEFKLQRSWRNASLWIILFVGLRIFRSVHLIQSWDSLSSVTQLSYKIILSILEFCLGLAGVAFSCSKLHKSDKIMNIFSSATVLVIFWYRSVLLYDKHSTIEARLSMALIVITGLISFVKHRDLVKTLSLMWMLWTALLMRPHNVILIAGCVTASRILFKLCSSMEVLILMHLWLEEVLFHCQGFYNSLSSVDISPGYVGLSEYSLVLAAFQVVCHTYTFKILSLLLLFDRSRSSERIKMLHALIIYRLSSITFYCFIILIHRQHLFIWSVFSPKLLIESCHAVCLLVVVLLYLFMSKLCRKKYSLNIDY